MSNPDEKNFHTYQDWLTWEGSWELINGKAYNMSPAPTSLHQFIVGELHFALRTFFQNRSCYVFVAPFDVLLSESEEYESPDHVTQPDLFVVCSKGQIAKNGCHGAPTLIIEVLSPSTALKDFNEKFNLYQKYKVQEYWIVDPGNRTAHVYSLQDGSYQARHLYTEQEAIQSIVIKDLQVPMSRLFSLE
ncbi:Uma2 family endonuclease [Paenibacillus radicis (ex Xue et al. 2023)]|uniref:Uma2 family endonuclease n=1 Tax=Paenibacillus radicis (ex Xue et al. 2023) TaxID=2972489 RepID=A0ABT1YKV8_9BACL|nr:Uma2 family endonuclease [Paenibacillus radicis (ex Xue et al. 2023)]MCR8633350.1 Uma2 family endonuclease [Paenibacillus radicis (ex Xue et al. 2023)]